MDNIVKERGREFAKRLQELLDYLDIYPATFAKNIAMTPTSIKAYLTGAFQPTMDTFDKILARYPVREEWLILNKGEMWENDYFKDRFIKYAIAKKSPKEKLEALQIVFDCNASKLSTRLGVGRAYISAVINERIKVFTEEKINLFIERVPFIPREWWYA